MTTTKIEIIQTLKNSIPIIVSAFLVESETYPKPKINWKYGYDLDFMHGEAIGWLESHLTSLFSVTFQRQPSSNEMMWIREIVQMSSEEIRATLLHKRDAKIIKLSSQNLKNPEFDIDQTIL